jgi:hypothetical protein
MSFATLAEIKTYLRLADDDTSSDTDLTRLASAASGWIERQCKRKLGEAAYTNEQHDGTGGYILLPRQYPVTDVAALSINETPIDKAPDTLSAGYILTDNVIRLRILRFTRGVQNVAITYTAGYPGNAIPDDLKQATIELVALKYREPDHLGQNSKTSANETLSYNWQVSNFILTTIENYRRGDQ